MRLFKNALAAVTVAAALLLAGCGGTGNSASGVVTDVTVWHYWDGTNADTFDAMVKEYNATHKDVHIKTSMVPNSDYLTKLRAAATSHTLPDVSIGDLIWTPQIAQMSNLVDLKTTIGSAELGNINKALLDYGSIKGKQVSVPVSANNLGYMYNKTVFKQAGLNPNKPPQTWDDLLTTAKTIKEKTGLPGYDLYTQAGDDGEGLTWNFQVFLWQERGQFLNKSNTAAAFNTTAGRKATRFWMDLIKSGASPYAKWGEFEKGKGGSAQEGSWMVGIWTQDPPFDFGTAPAPYPTDGVKATNLGGEQAMVFNNSSAKAKAASDFLTWFLKDTQVTKWSEKTGMLPVTQSVADSSGYNNWVKKEQPSLLPFVQQMKNAHTRPNTPLYSKISYVFAQQMEKIFAGQVSVNDGLTNAEKAVNDVIKSGN